MRVPRLLSLAAALVFPLAAGAQADSGSTLPSGGATPAATGDSAMHAVSGDAIHRGALTVHPGERVMGDLVTVGGDLTVRGEVTGNVVAIFGDVVLPAGGTVRGDAVAIGGTVRRGGGHLSGEPVSLTGPGRPSLMRGGGAMHGVAFATGWLLLLAAIGVAVLVFARRNLERMADAIEGGFARAFMWGLAGQLALLPVMLLLIVGLAVTILGILLIPFAIVAYFTAAAGALALGFIAMAFVAGDAIARRLAADSVSRTGLVALALGLLLFFGLWLLPAALAWSGLLAAGARLFAAAITWVALTVGLGAAIVTRGGSREASELAPPPVPQPDDLDAWQTPTPVTGVVAARRPTPYPGPSRNAR